MDKTIFSSAARTSTENSSAVDSPRGFRGVVLHLDVTAASGTTPTLDVKIQGQDTLSGNWFDLPGASFTQKTTTGSDELYIYPGTAETANEKVSYSLPNNFRAVATIGGTTPSFTFSLGASFVE